MKPRIPVVLLALAAIAPVHRAHAIGCISGGLAGGIAGHMAHHGVLGAVGGCIAGHEIRKHQQRPAGPYPNQGGGYPSQYGRSTP